LQWYREFSDVIGAEIIASRPSSAETDTDLIFKTSTNSSNAVEAMRIDNSGNLLVGTDALTPGNGNTDTGHLLKNDGRFFASSASNSQFNRNSDGDILTFRESGALVGGIGTRNGDLTVGTGGVGLQFEDSTNTIDPVSLSSNVKTDGVVNLGESSARFKDLYLSNAVVQNGVKATTTATTQVAIETFAHASHDGAKVIITAATSADTYVTELLIATNGTTAVATEYGQIGTGSALATYDVDISGADVRILATPASTTSTTFRVAMTLT
jgi:hypothetical protein